uniref:Uncharacterized protein n=1 Tax=Callithrix jacchus TaxID=9483 RepID=A0A2R8M5R9_CALJA
YQVNRKLTFGANIRGIGKLSK